jgi:phenylalanyl-tRNA synthetase alpha chain
MFHQCEGLWVGENVSFKDLKVIFTDFCRTFSKATTWCCAFRPSFFPFTEPSAEIDIQFQTARWLALAGGGGLRPGAPQRGAQHGPGPRALHRLCLRHGADRLTMLRYGVNDLRLFFDGDIRFLSQFQ